MEKYQNKYRIPSARASWWDYTNNGLYFVTICTANREHYFGDIKNGEMILSEIGTIAQSCWLEIPQHFSFINLDAIIVMPNHIHGIVNIDKSHCVETLRATSVRDEMHATSVRDEMHATSVRDEKHATSVRGNELNALCERRDVQVLRVETLHVQTLHATSLRDESNKKNEQMAAISPKFGSLGSVIRSYKSAVTKNARTIHADFGWQSRFHDHVIRDEKEYQLIKNYIINNPSNWQKDKFYANE